MQADMADKRNRNGGYIMQRYHHWGLGMRTLKTALAIWLAFAICDLLQFPNSALAPITAIVALQPSLKGSLTTIKNQLIATTFGCCLAVIVAYYFHGSYTVIAVSAILAIMLCVRLNLKDSIVLLLVTMILIGQTPLDNFQLAIVQRVSMILIGLGVGFCLNFVLRPQHQGRLGESLNILRTEFEQLYRDCVEDLRRDVHLEKEVVQQRVMDLRDQIQETRNIYKLSVDSRLGYDEKNDRDDLYLARRMVNALASNLERLVEIHRSIVLAPCLEENESIRQMVYQYLMEILYNHQRVYEYVLFDAPFSDDMMQAFACREVQLEQMMLSMLRDLEDLLPLHYWNMTVEAERIMFKTWNLSRIKREIHGEPVALEEMEDLYRLQ